MKIQVVEMHPTLDQRVLEAYLSNVRAIIGVVEARKAMGMELKLDLAADILESVCYDVENHNLEVKPIYDKRVRAANEGKRLIGFEVLDYAQREEADSGAAEQHLGVAEGVLRLCLAVVLPAGIDLLLEVKWNKHFRVFSRYEAAGQLEAAKSLEPIVTRLHGVYNIGAMLQIWLEGFERVHEYELRHVDLACFGIERYIEEHKGELLNGGDDDDMTDFWRKFFELKERLSNLNSVDALREAQCLWFRGNVVTINDRWCIEATKEGLHVVEEFLDDLTECMTD